MVVSCSLTELAARSILLAGPEEFLERLTWPYRGLRVLLAPFLPLLAPLFRRPPPEEGEGEEAEDEEASEEEIEAFLEVGTREGILDAEERELVWGVVTSATRRCQRDEPRIDMVCAPAGESLEALANRFVSSSHSRIPLFVDSIDRIVGILHIRDVLSALRSPEPVGEPAALAQAPLFVPETKPLGELLRELQARRQQMAIVVDEYGGTAGLVTIEDLIEEIVGEIADEHDEETPARELLPDGSAIYDGRTHIEELEEEYGLVFADPPFETSAASCRPARYVPKAGEAIEIETFASPSSGPTTAGAGRPVERLPLRRRAMARPPGHAHRAPNAASRRSSTGAGEKLAIVSDKPQTRTRMVGILSATGPDRLLRHPGVHRPLHG